GCSQNAARFGEGLSGNGGRNDGERSPTTFEVMTSTENVSNAIAGSASDGFFMDVDLQRRFGGLERLYGVEGAARIRAAHVAVVGIGGVGSWSAEALARSGVGTLTLIDLDNVAESNI